VPLVAGAKRPRSSWRGVLLAFQPLSLSWSGNGDVKTLAAAEWQPGLPLLEGGALACGFYLNELLLKLLARRLASRTVRCLSLGARRSTGAVDYADMPAPLRVASAARARIRAVADA
jgi:hypothetical protein